MSSILKIEFEKLLKTKSFWAIMLFLVFITSTVAITRSLEVGGSVGGINPAEPRAENGYFFEDNEENETGKLQIADWALIGKNDDFIAYLDQQLLMDTDERVNGVLSSISTASGKEIEIKLPYPLIYMDKEKEIDRNMPYKIAVTKYPSRKYIQFG